jgi:hypothetical protein
MPDIRHKPADISGFCTDISGFVSEVSREGMRKQGLARRGQTREKRRRVVEMGKHGLKALLPATGGFPPDCCRSMDRGERRFPTRSGRSREQIGRPEADAQRVVTTERHLVGVGKLGYALDRSKIVQTPILDP